MRNLWAQIVQTAGATGVTILASLVTITISTRVLGPDGRGLFIAATSWVGLFATLGTLSLGQVVVHRIAGQPSEQWRDEIAGTATVITIGATSVGWLVFALLYVGTHGGIFGNLPFPLLALAFLSLPLLMWAETGRYLLIALDSLQVANVALVIGAVASVVGIILLVGVWHAGVRGAIAATVLANLAVATWIMWSVRRQGAKLRPRLRVGIELLRGSARLHVSTVGNFVYAQASVLVLNYYRPPAETAYYQFAVQLFSFALIASTAVSTVAFGIVARKGPDGAWPEQRRLIGYSMLLVSVIGSVGYVLAPLGVRLVAGERFAPSVTLFRMIIPALYGATFATVMASQWIGRGLFTQAAALTLLVAVVSLGLDLVIVPRYGMRGAVVSTLVTYAISVVGNGAMALWVQRRCTSSLAVLT